MSSSLNQLGGGLSGDIGGDFAGMLAGDSAMMDQGISMRWFWLNLAPHVCFEVDVKVEIGGESWR